MKDNNTIQINLVTGNQVQPTVIPQVFDGIVGQSEGRKKLSFFVKSHSPDTPFPTMLFTGSHGLGKSFMAAKTAEALGREIVEVNCGTVKTPEAFIEGVLFAKVLGATPKTILMDEAHELSEDVTTLLLTLLNPTQSHRTRLHYKNWVIEYDLSKINIIFATTDAHAIFKPLLNRCTEIYFHPYSNDELYQIVRDYTAPLCLLANKTSIAYACRGRARDAYILSQNIRRYATMEGSNTLTFENWKSLTEIFGIFPMGLNAQEIKVMRILAEHTVLSCHNIAVMMMVEEENISSEIEVRPKELGLIENTPKGRKLTPSGIAYLKKVA